MTQLKTCIETSTITELTDISVLIYKPIKLLPYVDTVDQKSYKSSHDLCFHFSICLYKISIRRSEK